MGVAPPAGRRGAAALVLTLGALSAFGPLCLDMYLPSLPELPAALHSTAGAAQLSLSACIVGLAGGQLVAGPLSDRFGRRAPLLIGVALFTVVSALCAVVTSMPLLIVLRVLQGAGGAAGIVIGRAVVTDLYSGKAAAAYFSTIAAINGMAPILAPVIGGQVLRLGSWRLVFWVLAGIGLAITALAAAVLRETLPAHRRGRHGLAGTLRSFRTVLSDRRYVGYVVAGTAVMAAMFGYISTSPFVLQDGFGLSPQQFSLCFAVNALGIVSASQVSRVLLRRSADPVALLTAGIGQAGVGALALLLATLFGWGLWPILVAMFVMVSAVGLVAPNSSALSMDLHREVAGAASALYGLTQFGLAAVTSSLSGLGDPVSGHALGVTCVVAVLLAALALLFARRPAR